MGKIMQKINHSKYIMNLYAARSLKICNHSRLPLFAQMQVKANSNEVSSKFDSDWLKADPTVLVLGFFGWTIPSAIPISGFGDDSLLMKFTSSISKELAHFPSGPVDSDIWIYMLLYHIGLFTCMLLGQIGVQARKQAKFQ